MENTEHVELNYTREIKLQRRNVFETKKVLIEFLKDIENTVTQFDLEKKLLFTVRELQSNTEINNMHIQEFENFIIKLERIIKYLGNLEVFMDDENHCKFELNIIYNNYKSLYYNLADVLVFLGEK